ncbi:DUF4129 domain-containing protein [Haloarcula salina]|uniref:DUF4129 domain-containing protein n=1 Tax=Haloarcula salina TaxID=1429914 RepID=A0AA41FYK0_9EURY|nr:DUF4129 domain-containing protein [Haloarcula salina]MBV0900966.1 DUF4129 domain-containing protein [Haloarcula salina]
MSASPARAALALLCAVAVLFGTALFPGALGVGLDAGSPLDGRSGGPVGPDGAPADGQHRQPGSTPVDASTAAPAEQTESTTATPDPTDTETTGADPDTGGRVSLVGTVVGLLLMVGIGIVAAGVYRSARSGPSDAGVLVGLLPATVARAVETALSALSGASAGRAFSRIPQLTTTALLAGSSAMARVAHGVEAVASGVLDGLAAGVVPIAKLSGRGLVQFPQALGALTVAPFRALGGLGGGDGLLSSLRDGVERPSLFGSAADERGPSTEPAGTTDDGGLDVDSLSVRDAWAAMTERVPVSNPSATTPGEYARAAIERGLPAEPVLRLTDLFRDVEYGGRSENEGRTAAARAAVERLLRGGDER